MNPDNGLTDSFLIPDDLLLYRLDDAKLVYEQGRARKLENRSLDCVIYISGEHTMTGETDKAKAAYRDFLALWKDADPDIPHLEGSQSRVRQAAIS